MGSRSADMYSLCLQRDFVARHFLVGGDWGDENRPHAHRYRLEVRLEGSELDRHGFLVDLVEFQAAVEAILGRMGEQTLNELPEFAGLNPSLEHFARIVCQELDRSLPRGRLEAVEVRLWEDGSAWASYRRTR